jgi:hypothetical protein
VAAIFAKPKRTPGVYLPAGVDAVRVPSSAPMDPQPRKRSGCMIALYVLFGVGLFFIVAGSIATYFFLQSERGQQILEVAQQGAEWVTVASQAPGTEELRQAGCEAAMVSDAGSALDIFITLLPEDKRAEARSGLEAEAGTQSLDELVLVVCTLPRFSTRRPACQDLARHYGDAVPTAPESFYLMVMEQGQNAPTCQGIYAPNGTLLETTTFGT